MCENENKKSTPPPSTRQCPGCGGEVEARRGVCPECGHMTTWFKIRFFGGCAAVFFALTGIVALWISIFVFGS